jgi:hypothetical protein
MGGDSFGEVTDLAPALLPRTWAGLCINMFIRFFILFCLISSLEKMMSSRSYNLVTRGNIIMNLDRVCKVDAAGKAIYSKKDCTYPNNDPDGNGEMFFWSPDKIENYISPSWYWSQVQEAVNYMLSIDTDVNAPYLDIPVLNLTFSQKYEFYEADERTSISKITFADRNGILRGGTSAKYYDSLLEGIQRDVPMGYGAHKKVSVQLNSYPDGASDMPSPNPATQVHMSDLIGNSLSHKFDESLKYLYAQYQVFTTGADDFFDHNLAVFIRFTNSAQLKLLKSCQLQFGVSSRMQYEAMAPVLPKYDREYQRPEWFPTL